MTSVKVFDPAMCCSTGVCGPAVDPDLARFAADLDWLSGKGVAVERFNLAQQPDAFVAHDVVTAALQDKGEDALPMILVNGTVVSEGAYPDRTRLAQWAALDPATPFEYGEAVDHLVGIGAAIACNCEPCLEQHVAAARALGVSDSDLARAVATADSVKHALAHHVGEMARSLVAPSTSPLQILSVTEGAGEGCCSGTDGCC